MTSSTTPKAPKHIPAPDETTLDSDVTKPSTTAPGDGPADTTNPLERASSVVPRPGPDAVAAGTVNSSVPLAPLPEPAAGPSEEDDEFEEYDALSPSGATVRVKRSLITGKSEVIKASAPAAS